jgi:hypothetical protein
MNKNTISRYCPFQNIEYLLTLGESLKENLSFLIFITHFSLTFLCVLFTALTSFKMSCTAYELEQTQSSKYSTSPN